MQVARLVAEVGGDVHFPGDSVGLSIDELEFGVAQSVRVEAEVLGITDDLAFEGQDAVSRAEGEEIFPSED